MGGADTPVVDGEPCAVDAVAEHRIVDCRRRRTGERDQVVGDLTLLAEVAVKVQAGPVEAQRPVTKS